MTIKLDQNLNIVWSAEYDGNTYNDYSTDLKLDSNGNIYVCGTTEKSNNGKDFLLIKLFVLMNIYKIPLILFIL